MQAGMDAQKTLQQLLKTWVRKGRLHCLIFQTHLENMHVLPFALGMLPCAEPRACQLADVLLPGWLGMFSRAMFIWVPSLLLPVQMILADPTSFCCHCHLDNMGSDPAEAVNLTEHPWLMLFWVSSAGSKAPAVSWQRPVQRQQDHRPPCSSWRMIW